jgi:hypothetical protein
LSNVVICPLSILKRDVRLTEGVSPYSSYWRVIIVRRLCVGGQFREEVCDVVMQMLEMCIILADVVIYFRGKHCLDGITPTSFRGPFNLVISGREGGNILLILQVF